MQRMRLSGDLFKEVPHILDWLEAKGLRPSRSRYAKYMTHINDFYAHGDPRSLIGLQNFRRATKSLNELIILQRIYETFGTECQEGFIARLKRSIEGQEHPESGVAGPSRDFLFELLVAAMFSDAGYHVNFGARTDVVAESENFSLYIECKRISSEKKFEENSKAAGKQLRREIERSEKSVRGLIFVDITNCLSGLPTSEADSRYHASLVISNCVNEFISRKEKKLEEINRGFLDCSLGICHFTQVPVWINDISFLIFRSLNVIAAPELPDDKLDDLKAIGKSLNHQHTR